MKNNLHVLFVIFFIIVFNLINHQRLIPAAESIVRELQVQEDTLIHEGIRAVRSGQTIDSQPDYSAVHTVEAYLQEQHVRAESLNREILQMRIPRQLIDKQLTVVRDGEIERTTRIETEQNIQLDRDTYIIVRADEKLVPVSPSVSRYISEEEELQKDMRYLNNLILIQLQDHSDIIAIRPVVIPDRSLSLKKPEQIFEGKFHIALVDINNPEQVREFHPSIPLQFIADVDDISPRTLSLNHTLLPLSSVNVHDSDPMDSVDVRIIMQSDLEGVSIRLPVRPALVFENPPPKIQGWGIESTKLTVRIKGHTIRDPVSITVTANPGIFENNILTIDQTGAGTVRLRSAGLGISRIRAVSPHFQDAEIDLRFVFPFPFLGAAIFGGIIGGLISRRKSESPGKKSPYLTSAIEGVGIGLLVAGVYYAVGINLLHIEFDAEFFTEGAVFALSALGALFGIRGINALKRSEQ